MPHRSKQMQIIMPKLMLNYKEIEFKKGFEERYSALTDWEKFSKICCCYLRRSIRVNTLKISVVALKKRLKDRFNLTSIPWCKQGFWIEHKEGRRDIGNTIEHALGYYYVQEAVSMVPPLVLKPKPGSVVLDMCASPGSKTTQIAAMMKNKGVLFANDYKGMRLAPLGINLNRCGVTNSIVTLMHGQWFDKVKQKFDYVLVDAPCSGTGTVRKSLKTLRIWNPGMVKKLSYTQKRLIETGFNLLKKGGVLVYSTCSLEPEEDEGVVDSLLKKFDNAKVEKVKLSGLKTGKAVLSFNDIEYDKQVKNCLRIWPQDNDTEGFFVVRIKKT